MRNGLRARARHKEARTALPAAAARGARQQLSRLATTWSEPSLEATALAVHPGLRRTLARYDPSAGTIELRADTAASPRFEAILVHEAAHAAVCQQHCLGRTRPHGPEWRRLMAAAGHAPSRRLALGRRCLPKGGSSEPEHRRQRHARRLFDHSCSVCQTRRVARRPMKGWRCASCVAGGLPGRLVIERRDSPAPRQGR